MKKFDDALEVVERFEDNKTAAKFRTSSERKELAARLANHLKKGHSLRSCQDLSAAAICKYMTEYPTDFDVIPEAVRVQEMMYERIGMDLMTGAVRGNSAVYIKHMESRGSYKPAQEQSFNPQEFFANLKQKSIVNEANNVA